MFFLLNFLTPFQHGFMTQNQRSHKLKLLIINYVKVKIIN